MTLVRTDIDLDTIILSKGAHRNAVAEQGCILEWVSYLAGEPWSDAPECVAPSIRSFCITWNDTLNDTDRNRLLKPFLTKVIGTNTGNVEHEIERFWLLCDWQIRTYTPAWLRLAGLTEDADRLAALDPIGDRAAVDAAMLAITPAKEHARAAGDAARDAAGDAAAARDAAWAAARDAARDAAWAAARAAWDAAGDAAGDAAAAWDAAWAAAGDAAWDAAWAAARDCLASTVSELQDSAVVLLDKLCAVGRG